MDKLRAIQLFVRLAEMKSFTAVANETSSSKSMISKEISRLEDDIGARLFHRSTRNIALTPVGEGYLHHCRELLIKVDDADSYVQDLQGIARGKLRINAPMALGISGGLSNAFNSFIKQYPNVELDLHFSDEPLDLIENGFDLGFRVTSRLTDSNYIGQMLTRFRYKVCTTERYLSNAPALNSSKDLSRHNCFVYSYFTRKNNWPLGEGVEVSGNIKANNSVAILEAVKAGLGIGFLPNFVCDRDIEKGNIIEILPNVKKPQPELFALYPARKHLPPSLTLCIQSLKAWYNK